jgi:thioesterase III
VPRLTEETEPGRHIVEASGTQFWDRPCAVVVLAGGSVAMSNGKSQTTQTTEAVAGEVDLETVVRCTEIDVNGHVNNAKVVEYLEWGREEWYDRNGFAYDRLEGMGAVTVVVNINLNYRQPCQQGDRLRIVTQPQKRGRTSFALAQHIVRSDGAVVADGIVTLVTVDPETHRAVSLPEEFARLFPSHD